MMKVQTYINNKYYFFTLNESSLENISDNNFNGILKFEFFFPNSFNETS